MDFVGCEHWFSVVHGALRPPSPLHRSGRPAWSRLSWPINEVGGSAAIIRGDRLPEGRFREGYAKSALGRRLSPRKNVCVLPRTPKPLSGIGQTKPSRSALRISAMGRQPRFRPATGAPVARSFRLVGAPRYAEGRLVSNKETSGIRPRRLNVHITEWTGEKGARQPHLFTAADGSPVLAFAGLWDRWRDPATREEILVLHDHRLGRQRLDGALSRPHAGAAGGKRFRCVA